MRSISTFTIRLILLALVCLYGCVPTDSIRADVFAGKKGPVEFRQLLVKVVIESGFVADKYSDEVPGNAPFRDLGNQFGATFTSTQSTRIRIGLSIDRDSKKADIQITEYLSITENRKQLSPQAVSAAEAILRQLRDQVGNENVILKSKG